MDIFACIIHKMGKVKGSDCLTGPGVGDTAGLGMFSCDRWHSKQRTMVLEIAQFEQ